MTESRLVLIVRNTRPYISKINWPYQIVATTNYVSMISNLPPSSQLKKCASTLNAQFEIRDAPEGIVGVQQSIKSRLKFLLTHIIYNFSKNSTEISNVIRVKLTGDGTQIARGLTVVNFAFTILQVRKPCL